MSLAGPQRGQEQKTRKAEHLGSIDWKEKEKEWRFYIATCVLSSVHEKFELKWRMMRTRARKQP